MTDQGNVTVETYVQKRTYMKHSEIHLQTHIHLCLQNLQCLQLFKSGRPRGNCLRNVLYIKYEMPVCMYSYYNSQNYWYEFKILVYYSNRPVWSMSQSSIFPTFFSSPVKFGSGNILHNKPSEVSMCTYTFLLEHSSISIQCNCLNSTICIINREAID